MIGSPLTKTARAAVARSHSIDQQLDEAREKRLKEVQLLILGSAGTGKSTFTKQLRLLHGDGFPLEERIKQAPAVLDNACEALTTLLHHMERLGIHLEDDAMKLVAHKLLQSLVLPTTMTSNSSVASSMSCSVSLCLVRQLWRFGPVQECYVRREEFDFSTTDSYFLENLDRISAPNYIPSVQDILHIRKPTLGVQEHLFCLDKLTYRVIDVAGQRSHRKKWIHLFDCVTSVMFFTSLSSFCEKMDEDPETNSLHDSVQLFEELLTNKFLTQTAFMLFLNKKDLLESRLKRHRLHDCFPQYEGDNTPESVTSFIREEFHKRKPVNRHIYTHVSCATDVPLMKTIIHDVMEVIIEINLRRVKSF